MEKKETNAVVEEQSLNDVSGGSSWTPGYVTMRPSKTDQSMNMPILADPELKSEFDRLGTQQPGQSDWC